MKQLGKIIGIFLFSLCVLCGCRPVLYGEAVSGTMGLSGELAVSGSTSMARVIQALGEGFCREYPGVRVQVSGTGSGEAVRAVRLGYVQLGNVSRRLRETEHPEEFEQVTLAMDGIVLAVHPENPVRDLTTGQIQKIFSGAVTNWSEVGGEDCAVTVLGRESASGTRDAFESGIGLSGCAYEAELTSNGEIATRISSDRCAIGYLSLDALNPSIQGLRIDGVPATEETIRQGSYRLQRPFLQIYRKGSDSRVIEAWLEYAGSERGQQVIREAGLIPMGREEST